MQKTVPEVIERVMAHLPNALDPTLVILKGHLLIEEELNAAIADRVKDSKYLEDARLRFDQLLSIAKALYFKQDQAWVWDGIKKLNSLRNLLAHQLEPPNLKAKSDELLDHVEKKMGLLPGSKPVRFRGAIAMLAAQILIYREMHEA